MIYTHQLSPIALDLGFFAIRWYGLAYIAGFLLARYWISRIDIKPILSKSQWDDFMTWCIIGVVIGGRLGHVLLYYPQYYFQHPLEILQVWQGGMAFHGGLVGVMIAAILFTNKHTINIWEFSDFLAKTAPFGLFFGRIANFINAELWGNITDGSWGVIFPNVDALPRHPSQLYEALTEGLLLLFIVNYFAKNRPNGFATGLFMLFYGILRVINEFFRTEEVLWNLPITYGQALSVPLIIFGWIKIQQGFRK